METTFKSGAIAARKLKNDSFHGIKSYIATEKETNLLKYLEKIEVKQSQVTYEFIRYGAKDEDFFKHTKDGKRNGKKFVFSLNWAFMCLQTAKNKIDKFGASDYSHFCDEQKKLKLSNTEKLTDFIQSNKVVKVEKIEKVINGKKSTKVETDKPLIPTSKKTGKPLTKVENVA